MNQLARNMTAAASFARDGFIGPIPLLSADQCRAVLNHFTSGNCPPPAGWPKGLAVTDWFFANLGCQPGLLKLLTPLLGEDIILWGSSVVRRDPGDRHVWHVDIESAAPDGRFVTVWIGLENTTGDSGLRMIAGSHLCDKTVQQFHAETGATQAARMPQVRPALQP